ncbi:MAG: hypothetical protein WDM89_19165, partial [Rhizomicrobium sp.]
VPGIIVGLVVGGFIRAGEPDFALLRKIDYTTVALAALFLGSLELLLKQAPQYHWAGAFIYALFALCAAAGTLTLYLCLNRPRPFVDLTRFRHGSFAVGCLLSFVLGMGLYGSTYIVAVFLGLVRGHTPLEIGGIMMVARRRPAHRGTPCRAVREPFRRADHDRAGLHALRHRPLSQRRQHLRVRLPEFLLAADPARLRDHDVHPALHAAGDGELDAGGDRGCKRVFNLMRNLGGAIGIALIDTILEQRTPEHATHIAARLQAGDPVMAKLVGLPVQFFHGHDMGPVDPAMRAFAEPLIKRAAMVQSFNEAWLVLGALFVLVLFAIPFIRGKDVAPPGTI